jgi:hypothetical protein
MATYIPNINDIVQIIDDSGNGYCPFVQYDHIGHRAKVINILGESGNCHVFVTCLTCNNKDLSCMPETAVKLLTTSKEDTNMSKAINDPVAALRDKDLDVVTKTLRATGLELRDGSRTENANEILLNALWAERRTAIADNLIALEAAEQALATTVKE